MSTWQYLSNRAYELCVKLNQQVIMLDLPMMTENELLGVVIFLAQMREC